MSATVEFDTGCVRNALVVPVEALAVSKHEQSCYVVTNQGLERRRVKTRRATISLLEVTAGLHEGEHVASRSRTCPPRLYQVTIQEGRLDPGRAARNRHESWESKSSPCEMIRHDCRPSKLNKTIGTMQKTKKSRSIDKRYAVSYAHRRCLTVVDKCCVPLFSFVLLFSFRSVWISRLT